MHRSAVVEEKDGAASLDRVDAGRNALVALTGLGDVVRWKPADPPWADAVTLTAGTGTGTGTAVGRTREHLSITPDQTMVFGDHLDDVAMAPTATCPFATANAVPLLTELVPWTAPTSPADGVVLTSGTVLGI